jgi:branched-subunit amino acid ABC-type transport system permease component
LVQVVHVATGAMNSCGSIVLFVVCGLDQSLLLLLLLLVLVVLVVLVVVAVMMKRLLKAPMAGAGNARKRMRQR